MRARTVIGCLVLVSLSFGARASAQDQPPPDTPGLTMSRPIEVLFGVDDLTSWYGRGQDLRLSVGIPMSERIAFELFGGAYRGNEEDLDISAVAGFQFRQRLMRVRRTDQEVFATYGLVVPIGNKQCGVASCYSVPPLLPLGTLGFGFQQSIASRLAIRAELQGGFVLFLPAGVRVAAAVVIPLGRMRVPRTSD